MKRKNQIIALACVGFIGLAVATQVKLGSDKTLAQLSSYQLNSHEGLLSLDLQKDFKDVELSVISVNGKTEVLSTGLMNAGHHTFQSQMIKNLSGVVYLQLKTESETLVYQVVKIKDQASLVAVNQSVLAITAGGDCSTLSAWQLKTYSAGNQITEGGQIYECKAYPYSGWCGTSTAYKPESGFAWADAWTKIGACGTTGSSSTTLSSVAAASSVAVSSVAASSVVASSTAASSVVASSVAASSVAASSIAASSVAIASSASTGINCSALATWKSTTSYAVAAKVQYSGSGYSALLSSKNKVPTSYPTYWKKEGVCIVATSSAAASSIAASSVAASSTTTASSASGCTATVVAGFNYNVTNGSTTAAGYQQNNYGTTSFQAGDKVVVEGQNCNLAATVAVQPAGDTWNLYFTTGYAGASGTNVRLAKVTGTISTSSIAASSVAASSVATSSATTTSSSSVAVSGTPLNQLITKTVFDQMFPNRGTSSCLSDGANTVYTYENFIAAASAYPLFAQEGTDETRKREIAAFLGQTSHETTGGGGSWCGGVTSQTSSCFQWGLCYTEEVGCNDGTCTNYNDYSNSTYPVVAGHSYHGRGPIQLSWNYNYGYASQQIFGDKMYLLNNPDLVKTNGTVAFKTAIWYWMTPQNPKPSSHDVIVNGVNGGTSRPSGYGLITNIINGGIECNKGLNDAQYDRVNFFKNHAAKLGVSPKPSTSTLTDDQYFFCATQPGY